MAMVCVRGLSAGGGPFGRLSTCCGTAVCDLRACTGEPFRRILDASSRPSSIEDRRRLGRVLALEMDSLRTVFEGSGGGGATFLVDFFDGLLGFFPVIFCFSAANFEGGGEVGRGCCCLVGFVLCDDEPVFCVMLE
jgi:hypothetical protein